MPQQDVPETWAEKNLSVDTILYLQLLSVVLLYGLP